MAEGVAFIHRHHIDFLRKAGLPLKAVRLTGGIVKSSVWTKIFADVLQVPVEGVDCEETGALGSAIAAGIGAGVFKSYEDAFLRAVRLRKPVLPRTELAPVYEKRYRQWSRINRMMMEYWDKRGEGELEE